MPPRSVIVVGAGRRGRDWIAQVGRHDRLRLEGVVDPDPEARAAARSSGPGAWPSLDDALAERTLDLAIIASPPEFHEEHATACLRAGIGVLVEKPMTLSLASALRMQREARSAGLPLLVGQNWRARPRELALRDVLAAGGVGAVHRVRLSLRARPVDVPYPTTPYVPLWEYGIHFLDLLRSRHRSEPTVRRAEISVDHDSWSGRIELGWPDGPRAVYRQMHGGRPFRLRELVIGSRGILYAGMERALLLGPVPGRRSLAGDDTAEATVLDTLLAAMEGVPTDLDVADNVRTIALVEAVIRSAERRTPIAVADMLAEANDRDLRSAPDA